MRPLTRTLLSLGACLVFAGPACAYTVTITAGTRAIYLQVGQGGYTGFHSTGGTPGANATVNVVSVTVPAASIGNGAAQTMTSDSTASNSSWDGFAYCSLPNEVYVAAWSRKPGGPAANATLTVSTPANLTSGANTIPFSQISWTWGGAGDTAATIPSGIFVGGTTQTLRVGATNNWYEQCLKFSYANSAVFAAGTYTGRATYTMSQP